MALEWLKPILGDGYTEEIDKAVSEQIGKGFVARADFNELKESKKMLPRSWRRISSIPGSTALYRRTTAAMLQ